MVLHLALDIGCTGLVLLGVFETCARLASGLAPCVVLVPDSPSPVRLAAPFIQLGRIRFFLTGKAISLPSPIIYSKVVTTVLLGDS